MKDNHNDYSPYLAFIGAMLLSISINQCFQAEELNGIKNELELLNINQQ